MRNLYLTNRFFGLFGAIALFFVMSYVLPFLFPVAVTLFILAVALTVADWVLLFNQKINVEAVRRLPKMLSLSDPNRI
jgi:hypothetical protein